MKIKRNGVEFELSEQEMNEAYAEVDRKRAVDMIGYAVQDITLECYGTDEPSEELLDHIGMTLDELIDDLYTEYKIHCENYAVFDLEVPAVKPFVESQLEDYGYFDLEG